MAGTVKVDSREPFLLLKMVLPILAKLFFRVGSDECSNTPPMERLVIRSLSMRSCR